MEIRDRGKVNRRWCPQWKDSFIENLTTLPTWFARVSMSLRNDPFNLEHINVLRGDEADFFGHVLFVFLNSRSHSLSPSLSLSFFFTFVFFCKYFFNSFFKFLFLFLFTLRFHCNFFICIYLNAPFYSFISSSFSDVFLISLFHWAVVNRPLLLRFMWSSFAISDL